MAFLRHHTVLGESGPRNYFGDGSDGDIRITSSGAEQSFNGGAAWQAIPGWTLVGSVVSIPSTQDGDMVVVNARTLTIDSGMTLTVANRCRGLMIYCQGNTTINGILSMTGRGCHANPADSTVTADTPVAPSDGNAVPAGGIALRRFAAGQTGSNTDTDLMHGCGQAAVDSEANQPPVDGNGYAVNIPRVGGLGGVGVSAGIGTVDGNQGGQSANGTGGGGSGLQHGSGGSYGGTTGDGTAGTCFGGGSASGGSDGPGDTLDAESHCGAGTDGSPLHNNQSGGVGNPGGEPNQVSGVGGLLVLIVGGTLVVSGFVRADGVAASDSYYSPGGSSGGGVVVIFAVAVTVTGTVSADGGPAAQSTGYVGFYGGPGGPGSVIGPFVIDPA